LSGPPFGNDRSADQDGDLDAQRRCAR
jgi:hypothetical protein